MNIEKVLTKYATKDINSARTKGQIAIVNTQHGNIAISYESKVYTITEFLNNNNVHYTGAKAGAIEFMKTAYTVVGE